MSKGAYICTVFIGPMFSGKSERLIELLTAEQAKNKSILAVRYGDDNRYSDQHIASHNGRMFPAHSAKTSYEIAGLISSLSHIDTLAIDEIQFFDIHLADLIAHLKEKGITIYAAGLDLDYLENKWETTEKVLMQADLVKHLYAVCTICSKPIANRTKRVTSNLERIVIGGKDMYVPRCEEHFNLP